MKPATVEVYRRADGRWDWRLLASNGQIIATSGSQGYERPGRAEQMARKATSGSYAAVVVRVP